MMNLERLLQAYEIDANTPQVIGSFEVLNMLTNREALEEQRNKPATLEATRLLFADEKLATNSEQIISECGGELDFIKLRQHEPPASAWGWFLEQLPVEQFS